MRPPCRDCTDRMVGCRRECKPWQAYEEQQAEIRRKRELEWQGTADRSDWGTKKLRARISARRARQNNRKG